LTSELSVIGVQKLGVWDNPDWRQSFFPVNDKQISLSF